MRFARIVVTKLIMLRTIPEHRAASVVLVALTILIGSGSCRERPENARRQSHETGRFDSYVLQEPREDYEHHCNNNLSIGADSNWRIIASKTKNKSSFLSW